MSDLIERQTVLRCIKESRENIDWGQSEDGDAFLHYSAALYRTIADKRYVPSAQPEIIRCKDCKYCEHWYADKGRCFLWHETGIDVFEDGFCNYAERRTDE